MNDHVYSISPSISPAAIAGRLDRRIGRLHLRQRQGIEREHLDRIFGRGRNLFHIENWYSVHAWIRWSLRLTGLYDRGLRNATHIQVRHNPVRIAGLPRAFEGFTLLHLSDLHLDMAPALERALIERVRGLDYDVCVVTGDFRGRTHGPIAPTIEAMGRLRGVLKTEVVGVLGNHDFIEMVGGLEALGIRLLLNESVRIQRRGAQLFLAGVDDPHYYCTDNLEKASEGLGAGPAILLSHSPEIFRHAAHAGFDLMLCGHTNGGQICLPGGFALTYNARCPRRLGRGAWRHQGMHGYTSAGAGSCVVPVRFNCPPEVTLHRLVGE